MVEGFSDSYNDGDIEPLKRHARLLRGKPFFFDPVEIELLLGSSLRCDFDMVYLLSALNKNRHH